MLERRKMFSLLSRTFIGLLTICIVNRATAIAESSKGAVPPVELYADSLTDSFMGIVIPLEPMSKVEFAVTASGFHGYHIFSTPVDIQWAVFSGGPDEADVILCQFFALPAGGEGEKENGVPNTIVNDMNKDWSGQEFTNAAVGEPFQRGESMTGVEGATGVYCVAYFIERRPSVKWDQIL